MTSSTTSLTASSTSSAGVSSPLLSGFNMQTLNLLFSLSTPVIFLTHQQPLPLFLILTPVIYLFGPRPLDHLRLLAHSFMHHFGSGVLAGDISVMPSPVGVPADHPS